ncbi:hypothetical protein E2562_003763 [Oryza meyeriana var. granulata]|uniref:Phytocyanin domain-containing protein n=1 Tax=Oryza meyeriana var. granulata TaxID=110450 RepID=A0A6G1BR64_9ORYZ|nr:hypothetical protein E2562_003763 [Oryza meyeriana var. granulata]
MARQGGGADMAGILVVVTLLLLQGRGGAEPAENSREWPVGDSEGWSMGVMGWPNYKPFRAGDVLRMFLPA